MVTRRAFIRSVVSSSILCQTIDSIAESHIAIRASDSNMLVDSGTHRFWISFPENFDTRQPAPLALCFHGAGPLGAKVFSKDLNSRHIPNAFSSAGYIVASASYEPRPNTWGSQRCIDAYAALYGYLNDNFSIGPIAIHCHSMGGIESLNCLAQKIIPGVTSWSGTNMTYNLENNWSVAAFKPDIIGAYDLTPDGSDYAGKTAGYDPSLLNGTAFGGMPMMVIYATDDAVVDYRRNSQKFISTVSPHLSDLRVAVTSGGHSFNWQPWAPVIAAFHNQYIA